MISVFPWSCICLLLLTFYSNQSPRGHSVTLTSAFTLLCSPLPCYIRTGRWDLQSMAKVMKLEGFVTEGVAASVLVSWIACSEGNPVTMLWGHSGNSGERPPHRGAEASRRQPSKLAGHGRALEADPASAKPSSDGNVDSHSTVTPGETLSQNFSAKPQKVGDNKCLLLFQVIKFGVFFFFVKQQDSTDIYFFHIGSKDSRSYLLYKYILLIIYYM